MAIRQVKSVLLRYLLVVTAMCAITIAAMSVVAQQTGVYQARVGVIVVPPNPADAPNPFLGREFSLIATAGLMATIVNDEIGGAQPSSTSVTLAGQGVRDGYSVRLHNQGGQWTVDYDRPILDVQAVGKTREQADANLDTALDGLDAALTQLQDTAGVQQGARMSLQLAPERPVVAYAAGSGPRAMAGTLVLGAVLTAALLGVVEHIRVRRRVAKILEVRSRAGRPTALATASPG